MDSLDNMSEWFAVDNSIESMYVISGVVDSPLVAISIDERVFALDNTSITGLDLALDISGMSIVDRVRELVLWMRIVVVLRLDKDWMGSMVFLVNRDKPGAGNSNECKSNNELKKSTKVLNSAQLLIL